MLVEDAEHDAERGGGRDGARPEECDEEEAPSPTSRSPAGEHDAGNQRGRDPGDGMHQGGVADQQTSADGSRGENERTAPSEPGGEGERGGGREEERGDRAE